jgi:prepilin-type N-terminal cleavage/methylation domain-containing protein
MLHFISRIGKRKFQKGFTLIELLVVISLMGILMVGSVSTFFSYGKAQSFQTGVSEVAAYLNKTKSRAISQVKPSVCGTRALEGYQFWHPTQGTYYRLSVRCGGTYHIIERKNLPVNVTFDSTSNNTIFFNVRTGLTGTTSTVVISGNSTTRSITVNEIGTITVQ